MSRRFIVTYDYTETVKGEPRRFSHETMIQAEDLPAANRAAVEHFEKLALQSGVGWTRVLHRFEVAPATAGAVAKGGKRVDPETQA